jgi:hypothetical protein
MLNALKWKKRMDLAVAVGIVGFSAYGIYHFARSVKDTQQAQAANLIAASGTSSQNSIPGPGGTLCNPDGCAGCPGCSTVAYEQNVATASDSTAEITLIEGE